MNMCPPASVHVRRFHSPCIYSIYARASGHSHLASHHATHLAAGRPASLLLESVFPSAPPSLSRPSHSQRSTPQPDFHLRDRCGTSQRNERNGLCFAAYARLPASSSIRRHDPSIIPDGRPRRRPSASVRPFRIVMNQFRQPKTQPHGVQEKVEHFTLISRSWTRPRPRPHP